MALKTTEAQWIRNTKSGWWGARDNPMITDIDILLRRYWEKPDLGRRAKILILIRYYCRDYVKTKAGNAASFLKTQVENLLSEVTAELNTPEMQTALTLRADGVRTGKQVPGKALDHEVGEQYRTEALQPRIKAKYQLQSNLQIHHMPAGSISELGGPGWSDNAGRLDVLDAIQDSGERSRIGGNLEYLDNQERQALLLSCKDGKLCLGASESPYTTTGHNDLWVEDCNKNFYLKPSGDIGASGGAFHHSSFLAGKPVVCGGGIKIRNGDLVEIDNGSGHYRPGMADLLTAVRDICRELGVSLQRVEVGVQGSITWKNGWEFLCLQGSVEQAVSRGLYDPATGNWIGPTYA